MVFFPHQIPVSPFFFYTFAHIKLTIKLQKPKNKVNQTHKQKIHQIKLKNKLKQKLKKELKRTQEKDEDKPPRAKIKLNLANQQNQPF